MHHQMWLVVYFLHFQPIPSLSLIIPIFFNILLLGILSFVFSPSLSLFILSKFVFLYNNTRTHECNDTLSFTYRYHYYYH